jgi:hypothetical protein
VSPAGAPTILGRLDVRAASGQPQAAGSPLIDLTGSRASSVTIRQSFAGLIAFSKNGMSMLVRVRFDASLDRSVPRNIASYANK